MKKLTGNSLDYSAKNASSRSVSAWFKRKLDTIVNINETEDESFTDLVTGGPTVFHWFHTISCFAEVEGGLAASDIIRTMRAPAAEGGAGLTPNQACYAAALERLIISDAAEAVAGLMVMMLADKVTLPIALAEKVKLMRRYDVVREIMEREAMKHIKY